MNEIGFLIFISVSWFVSTIVFHEVGHWIVAKFKRLPARFGGDKKSIYVRVSEGTKEDHDLICLGGVLVGFIPTLVSFNLFSFVVGALFTVAYVFGFWSEIKRSVKMFKQ